MTFYSFLNESFQGKFVIRLCRTISCDMAGKERVARQLENDLGIDFGETTADGKFTLQWATAWACATRAPRCWSTTRSSPASRRTGPRHPGRLPPQLRATRAKPNHRESHV